MTLKIPYFIVCPLHRKLNLFPYPRHNLGSSIDRARCGEKRKAKDTSPADLFFAWNGNYDNNNSIILTHCFAFGPFESAAK
jgi:hypothetical protein